MIFTALIIQTICIVVSIVMQQVEKQEQRHSEDNSLSPKEREKAEIKVRVAHFSAKFFPILSTVYLVVYMIWSVAEGVI